MSKQLSGAQKRKIQKRKFEDNKKLSMNFSKWLNNGVKVVDDNEKQVAEIEFTSDASATEPNSEHEIMEEEAPDEHISTFEPTAYDDEKIYDNNVLLNFNDPHSWPNVTKTLIEILVKHGPDQGTDENTIFPADNVGRKFSLNWFNAKQNNGEIVSRKWLLYSKIQDAVFCFPSILFGKKFSNLTNSNKGFHDWAHLHPFIPNHESSAEHKTNYVEWKILEKNLNTGNTLDDYFINSINNEKTKWREVLKVIVDCILFCAKNNIGLRGTNEKIGESDCGIFLNLIALTSHYKGASPL